MKTLPPRRPKMPKLDLILSATSVSLSVSVSLAVAVLLCCTGFISAERDFNFNDSQVPLLEPKDEPRHIKYGQPQDPYAVEVSRCDYADTEILLTLVLKNDDWHDLSDNKKAKVLRKLSKFFAIPKEFIVMESVKKRDLNEMQKSAIRKGENKCHSKRQFGRVNFMLGCGASYFPMGELIANQIGAQMKDGSIDGITGEEFGWWVIWRKDFSIRAPRSRRQVEGSGESDFDYEDDYEYEDDEEETADTVTEVPTVPTHAHRHHHGTSDTQSALTDSNLELTNAITVNNAADEKTTKIGDAADDADDVDDVDDVDTETDTDTDSDTDEEANSVLLLNKNANIDEEIVESVSQLESVISKTIENTKHIKELPVVEDDLPAVDVPTVAEIEQELDLEYNNELVQSHMEPGAVATMPNNMQIQPLGTTTTTSATTITTNHASTSDGDDDDDDNVGRSATNIDPDDGGSSNNELTATVGSEQYSSGGEEAATIAIAIGSVTAAATPTPSPSPSPPPPPSPLPVTTTASQSSLSPASSSSYASFTPAQTPASTMPLTPTTAVSSGNNAPSPSPPRSQSQSPSPSPSSAASPSSSVSSLSSHTHSPAPSSVAATASLLPSTTTQQIVKTTPTPASSLPSSTSQSQSQSETEMLQTKQKLLDSGDPRNADNDERDLMVDGGAPTITSTPSDPTFITSTSTTTTGNTTTFGNKQTTIPRPSTANNANNANNQYATASSSLTPIPPPTPTPTTSPSPSPSTLTTTTTPVIAAATPSSPVIQITSDVDSEKDGTDETTLLPSSNQDAHAKASMTPPTTNDVAEGTSSSSTTVLTPMTAASSTPEPIATDYIDLKPENTPPMIKTRLQKLAITSGKSFRLTVPAETFYDNEDNTNLRLVLTEKDGRELKPTSWLQFNAETREIYGLPLDDTVSKYQYLLSATDSGNESVTETVEISVQQHHSVRSVNHEINIAVKINDKQMYNIDWQVKLIRAIATTLDDATTDAIVVREIRQATQDPNTANFVYFNETLPTATCPEAELNSLVKRFDASRLSDLVSPTLGVKSITGQLIGTCQKLLTSKPKPTTHTMKNAPPMPRNQVDRVNATVNHLLVYKVPSDTFYDPSDSDLKLSLRAKDNKEISPSNWLQFDSKNQEFYGIPKSSDFGSEEYILVAEDSGGLTATDALVVVVSHAPKKEFGVFFKAYLAIRLEQFNADLQRKFVERVAELFGDHTTQYVQLRSVNTDRDSDGIIVNFYNTTLFKAHNRCPDEQIEAVRNVYLMQDHTLRDRVKKALGSELNLTNLKVSATSSCDPKIDGPHRESTPTKTETEPTLKSTFAHDHMYTVILPAVIIVTMIVIASLIACCLHRRRRKSGKMELGDEEERKSFRAKGIPVIFQDELDEKPEIGNKSPIILKDEKPPLLPPSYNTSNMNGDTDVDEYVPPPAVVVGGREVRGKSPATPSYRKPPPYVSP